jgi:beta-lactamase superfamily II metal-dependent hydrolase
LTRTALLTGDAGIPALEDTLDRLEDEGWRSGTLNFVQVPHHGSQRNVGPSVLDRLLGPKGQGATIGTAFVSAPAKNPEHKHPAKKVTNSFLRRGYPVHATQGTAKWHYKDAPQREDYSTSEPLPLYDQVEEDSEA